jgi:hypothetical protein
LKKVGAYVKPGFNASLIRDHKTRTLHVDVGLFSSSPQRRRDKSEGERQKLDLIEPRTITTEMSDSLETRSRWMRENKMRSSEAAKDAS